MTLKWTKPVDVSILFGQQALGKLVTFTVLHQAELTQYVKITNQEDEPITFTTMNGEESSFPISGQGTTVGFFNDVAGYFFLEEGYQIYFANSGTQQSKFQLGGPTTFTVNGEVYGGVLLFAVEDFGGEEEYDDTTMILEWYKENG